MFNTRVAWGALCVVPFPQQSPKLLEIPKRGFEPLALLMKTYLQAEGESVSSRQTRSIVDEQLLIIGYHQARWLQLWL